MFVEYTLSASEVPKVATNIPNTLKGGRGSRPNTARKAPVEIGISGCTIAVAIGPDRWLHTKMKE